MGNRNMYIFSSSCANIGTGTGTGTGPSTETYTNALEYNDVLKAKYNLDYVPVPVLVPVHVPVQSPYPNPNTKYYITSLSDITDFLNPEYYDYLSSIDNKIWAKYKEPLMDTFPTLEISSIPILKLFVEKLSIDVHTLITSVKRQPSNSKLLLCVMINYYEDFVNSINYVVDEPIEYSDGTIGICDKSTDDIFFTRIVKNCDLTLNKYVYHNIYSKAKTKPEPNSNACPYRRIFFSIGTDNLHLDIVSYDVFEYFVKIFNIDLKKMYKCDRMLEHLAITCSNEFDINYMLETLITPVKTDAILKQMVCLTGCKISTLKYVFEREIVSNYTVGENEMFTVRVLEKEGTLNNLVKENRITELIEIFRYTKIDFKKFDSHVVIYMLIDVLFSNDEGSVREFLQYLKWGIGYVLDYAFFEKVMSLLKITRGKYNYLRVRRGMLLEQNILDGLMRMMYAGSTIKFVRK